MATLISINACIKLDWMARWQMPRGSLTSARVRIGFSYQDAKNNGVSGYGAPSDNQIIATHQKTQKAKERLERDLARLQRLPGLQERVAKYLQDGLSIRETVRQLKRDERQLRPAKAQNSN
jgi:hypothetical protein